jgi:mono/diheme cytochrome c family protein
MLRTVGSVGVVFVLGLAYPQAAQQPATRAASAGDQHATVQKYCATCHNGRTKAGGLALDSMDFENIPAGAAVWEKSLKKMRVGMMPPPSAPQPDAASRASLISWLTTTLDGAAAARPNPGRPVLHRLNRAEYANAVRDLLALDVDPSGLLPPDDSAYGFDNVGDVLGMSPVLLERFMEAANKVGALAIGDPDIGTAAQTFHIRQDASQDTHVEGLPIGTVGGILAKVTLPLDAEYQIAVKMFRTNLGVMRGLEYEHDIEYTVDGARVHVFHMGGEADFKANLVNMTKAGDVIDERGRITLKLTAGPHVIGAAFIARSDAPNPTRLQPFIRSSTDTRDTSGHPHFDTVTVTGPFKATGPGDTPSRRRILTCRPESRRSSADSQASEDGCARQIIARLARLAYRGDVTEVDRQRLFAFFDAGRRDPSAGSGQAAFERGIQKALQRILASPKFCFHIEQDPAGLAPATVYRISDRELAARLSFFLWSSIPDTQLLDLAAQNKLHTPAVLEQQARRMLTDRKADALTTNFAGQWLYLRNLKNIQPNSEEFPDFDDNLRQAFEREASLFFASIVHEDRNVLDLMTADFTYLNERLAQHYGVPNVYGSHFRRVTLTDQARFGLLGKGAVLMVTSHVDRTSPVVRGKWVLDNLLSAPVPPMAANVPPLNEDANRGGRILTMRERMEEHRRNPVCAQCHKIMDPIGLSMENFDAVGAWRTRDGDSVTGPGTPIDAQGELLDGSKINGVVTLRQALLRQPDLFVGTVTEKLMIYALGRGLQPYDMPTVRAIVRDTAQTNYRFSSIVMGIINSTPFQKRVTLEEPVRIGRLEQGSR